MPLHPSNKLWTIGGKDRYLLSLSNCNFTGGLDLQNIDARVHRTCSNDSLKGLSIAGAVLSMAGLILTILTLGGLR